MPLGMLTGTMVALLIAMFRGHSLLSNAIVGAGAGLGVACIIGMVLSKKLNHDADDDEFQ